MMMTTTACSFPTSDLAKVSKSKLRLGVSKSCSISQSSQSSNLSPGFPLYPPVCQLLPSVTEPIPNRNPST